MVLLDHWPLLVQVSLPPLLFLHSPPCIVCNRNLSCQGSPSLPTQQTSKLLSIAAAARSDLYRLLLLTVDLRYAVTADIVGTLSAPKEWLVSINSVSASVTSSWCPRSHMRVRVSKLDLELVLVVTKKALRTHIPIAELSAWVISAMLRNLKHVSTAIASKLSASRCIRATSIVTLLVRTFWVEYQTVAIFTSERNFKIIGFLRLRLLLFFILYLA